MRLYKETIIYVGCPSYNKTGGTELAHQLVKEICKNGRKAKILYYDINEKNKPNEMINPAFRIYVDNYVTVDQVVDERSNILVIPEINIEVLNRFERIQKSIWWMSVDNYVKRDGFVNAVKFYGFWKATKLVLKREITIFEKKLTNGVTHLYQSEYAKKFLLENGITNIARLSDYLNDTYLNVSSVDLTDRHNNVLYNPKKGIDFTKKLIATSSNLNWVPIQNMTTEEVRELLLHSKVYIDFGNHPGKDRFPREAAISGCCIITGKRGSAANDIDINIPKKYKFDDTEENIASIIEKIKFCLNNYRDASKDYEEYRRSILSEKAEFISDVKKLFIKNNV